MSCGLAAPALAQDQQPPADDGVEVTVTTERKVSAQLAIKLADGIKPLAQSEGLCAPGAIARPTEASSLGCAFEDTTLGFTARESLGLGDALVGMELSVGRGTSGAFALDHTMRGYRRGLNAEATLTSLSLDAELWDGRVEWKSGISWSSEWQAPVAQSTILPVLLDETSGSASNHRLKIKLVDDSKFKWSVEGQLTRADRNYRPFYVSLPDRLFAAEGESARLNSRLILSDWRLNAGVSSVDNTYFESERNSASVSHSGVTLRWSSRNARSKVGPDLLTDRQTSTNGQTVGLDLDAFAIVPMIAIEDRGLASLVPKMLSFEMGWRDTDRTLFGQTGRIKSNSVGVFGLWTTPLGDTILNYRTERERGVTPLGDLHKGSENFLMVSQSVRLGDWSIDVDYVSSTDATGDNLIASDGSALASAGIGIGYSRKERPEIDFRIGRDNLDISTGEGALQLRDRSMRAELDVDFTPWLKKITRRDDMRLKLDMQWDFDDSGYEFRLFDEVIDREFETRQGRGALLTFVMELN